MPALEHRCELFAIGLIDNPYASCDLAERRKLREEYAHKWSDTASFVESTHKLPPNPCFSGWGGAEYSGNGLFITGSTEDECLALLHVPPVASRKPIENWSIPLFPGWILCHAAYLPGNVVAVAEEKEKYVTGVLLRSKIWQLITHRLIRIHLLDLRDGSPHHIPASNLITWELPLGSRLTGHCEMAITGSRIRLVRCGKYDKSAWVVVWNWKTGESVKFCGLDDHTSCSLHLRCLTFHPGTGTD